MQLCVVVCVCDMCVYDVNLYIVFCVVVVECGVMNDVADYCLMVVLNNVNCEYVVVQCYDGGLLCVI